MRCTPFLSAVILALSFASTTSQGGSSSNADRQLVLTHDYPFLDRGNLSFVRLACSARSCDAVTFLRNGTDVANTTLSVSDCVNGSIAFVLRQRDEGYFACSFNDSRTSNAVTLAAPPDVESLERVERFHVVSLRSFLDLSTTELECGIAAGTLRERYSVEWYRTHPTRSRLSGVGSEFSVTLNVTVAANRSQYQCEVTINHNGSLLRTYTSPSITLTVTLPGFNSSGDGGLSPDAVVALSFFLPLVVTLMTLFVVAGFCLCHWYTRTKCPALKFSVLKEVTLNFVAMRNDSELNTTFMNTASRDDLEVANLTVPDGEAETLISLTSPDNADQSMKSDPVIPPCNEQCIEGTDSITYTNRHTTSDDVGESAEKYHQTSCGNTDTSEGEDFKEERDGTRGDKELNQFYSNFRQHGFDYLTDHTPSRETARNGGVRDSVSDLKIQAEPENNSNKSPPTSDTEEKTCPEKFDFQTHVPPNLVLQDSHSFQDKPSLEEAGGNTVSGMIIRHWSVSDARKSHVKHMTRQTSIEVATIIRRNGLRFPHKTRERRSSAHTSPRNESWAERRKTSERVERWSNEGRGSHTLPRSGRRHTIPRTAQRPSVAHHPSLGETTGRQSWSEL